MKKYFVQRSPTSIPTDDGKRILEHFGMASIASHNISIAHMTAPPGWSEPFQTPEFDEYTFIIKGKKQITIDNDDIVLSPGESIKVLRGNRLKYSNPFTEPCEYISICVPAFTLDSVNRDNA